MKCTNCGKNNAVAHYRFELNGEVQEAHLCAECAAKLQPEREFVSGANDLFGDLFDGGFFGGDIFGRRLPGSGMLRGFLGTDPFESFFGRAMTLNPFAMLGVPHIEISFPDAGNTDNRTGGESAKSGVVDPELSKKRELNALREQLRLAVEKEEYEKAAELKAKLRALEEKK